MSHRKVLSQGNVPFSWEEKPGVVSKFFFRDFQALALHSSPPPQRLPPDYSSQFEAVSKIPPPPCRLQPRPVRNASARGIRGDQEDPFLVAYKECTKSVKNGKFKGSSKGAAVKKSKLFGFSCKSIHSCEVRDDNFLKLPKIRRERIHVSSWK